MDKTYLDQHPDNNCWFDYHGNPTVDLAYYGIHCKRLLGGFSHLIGQGASGDSIIKAVVVQWRTETVKRLLGRPNIQVRFC